MVARLLGEQVTLRLCRFDSCLERGLLSLEKKVSQEIKENYLASTREELKYSCLGRFLFLGRFL